jgi:ankyrin repeat protein
VKKLISQTMNILLIDYRTPLQWAIKHNHLDVVRILIENGADLEHVSTLGWSPIFYCWPHARCMGKEQSEMLKILYEHSVLDFEHTDTFDWTIFQRASAFGTSNDIEILITLGAKPLLSNGPLQWSAIHYAVDAGNWDTFTALLPYYGSTVKDIVDERGWSLLHLAAARGNVQIMRYLLQLGANHCLQSISSRAYLPEALFDRRCTPEDVAEVYGQEQHKLFLGIVQKLGLEVDCDLYWDAAMSFSDNI